MLEGLAAWVINNYLGKYVENLNTHQLSIALLQGAVELENLPLRKDALRHIGLPIEVRAGFIGKVKLKIPISQITSAPWEISIEKLYVVASPIRLSELDEEAEEQALLDYKLSLLDGMEACWRSEAEGGQDTSSYYASSYSSWLGLSMSFATNIIENLQLKIKDVHLRYEDKVTIENEIFAGGIKIESLTGTSCDETWTPKYISCHSSNESFKLLEMTGFSIYWDRISEVDMCCDLQLSKLAEKMCASVKLNHDYVLSPVSSEAKMKRNRSEQPLRSRHHPRIVCDLTLQQVPLVLLDWQYSQMVRCKRGLEWLDSKRGHLKSRPKRSPSEDPVVWWKYAVSRLMVHRHLSTWPQILSRAKDNVCYVALYTKQLTSPAAATPLSEEEKTLKDKMERNLSFDQLRILREVAMSRARPGGSASGTPVGCKNQESLSMLARWFPGWWGWQTAPDEGSAEPTHQPQTSHLDNQLLDVLADTVENNTLLKRDSVFGQFNFSLNKGKLHLCHSTREPLVELEFENVTLGYESRPRTGSHSFNITLGAIYLKDHLTKDSCFPVLISPQNSGVHGRNLPPGVAKLLPPVSTPSNEEPLFNLMYEFKPFGSNVDNRLMVSSKSLDVVYNGNVMRWIVEFFTGPYFDPNLRRAARKGYHAIKMKTKQQLLNNWETILQGNMANRKTWDFELNISAPQILLVEHFNDKDAVLCLVDFGKLHFTNRLPDQQPVASPPSVETEDEDADFQTPCSTPPGSISEDLVNMETPNLSPTDAKLCENILHNRLYDRYTLNFCDLQILVGKVRDNWKFAHLKGTSTLHVLDKFNISLQIERRVVFTIDPQFPSLTVSGCLPKLVAHVNEQKVYALKILTDIVLGQGLISPLRSQDPSPVDDISLDKMSEDMQAEPDNLDTSARLVMLQFCIDQMALEVQSRGRSVAEVQVNGVKLSFTKRPFDTSLSLSVHGLLLVDALQNYGQDFELLVASHKHVGMDTLSGSLQDSEPTSPVSPSSPEPKLMPTSPMAISQALSSLSQSSAHLRVRSPDGSGPSSMKIPLSTELPDSEALITVELLFVSADCPTNLNNKEHLQVANIQFNNLDIIANQETIVELMGFVKRVFPKEHSSKSVIIQSPSPDEAGETDERDSASRADSPCAESQVTRTQVTFDFHRLNVLLLRAVVRDSGVVAKKIATATMSEAKIHANIGKCIEVEGSLGGLQVLDLSPGCLHQRIVSIGEDPVIQSNHSHTTLHLLSSMARNMYAMSRETASPPKQTQAFSFSIKRTPLNRETDVAEISVRMASVWYVHSPRFLYELKSCAAEFKQYLSNLARSISSAATEVAMGLMHARTESLAQSLSMGGRLYGSSGDISQAPRRFRSVSYSQDFIDFSKGTNTPHSPCDQNLWTTLIKWDVVLASPVVVVPRNPTSTQVVVGHLGGINITNSQESPVSSPWGPPSSNIQKFSLQIRDVNLYTIDISNRMKSASNVTEFVILPAEKLYSSSWDSKPVLHDTNIHLTVTRQMGHIQNRSDEILLDGQDMSKLEYQENIQVNGKVVTKLKLSLSRQQYEQLIETTDSCLSEVTAEPACSSSTLADIVEGVELHTGVSTLSLDPALRARMVMRPGLARSQDPATSLSKPPLIAISVCFELPELTMELMADVGVGEQGLVDLSFKDLIVVFDKTYKSEVNIQVSLRSVTMEDLQKPLDSKYRWLMSSSNSYSSRPDIIPSFYSRSCPELAIPGGQHHGRGPWHCSLPDHLETEHVLGAMTNRHKHILAVEKTLENRRKGSDTKCPYTPPPSPRGNVSPPLFHEDNLVHVNVTFKPSPNPNVTNTRHMTVDFNSLDVIVNVESWLVVLDFFGISDIEQEQVKQTEPLNQQHTTVAPQHEETDSVLVVSVRSLSLLLNRAEYEVARATMSQLKARLITSGLNPTTQTDASVGSFTLTDLTPIHSTLYRHRFITAGLKLNMIKHNSHVKKTLMSADYELKMEMNSLVYVHTQRYVAELQAFFRLFPHLRKRIGYSKGNEIMKDDENTISTRVLLQLSAVSPIILLPVSSVSHSVLIADLGNLKVSNQLLMSSSPGTIGCSSDPATDILLDVMSIELESMDLLTGERKLDISPCDAGQMISVASYYVQRKGTALLREKCHLSVHVERNLMPALHCVPDLSIQGTLSTLAANLTLSDYKLISGLLSYNIGECLDDISPQPEIVAINSKADVDVAWTCTSLRFELVNVNVQLLPTENTSLACINFIKSILLIETYSNRSQDIDLVSQEILITDTRFSDQPANKRSNVFTNILQPIHMICDSETVQAQVHHRKGMDLSKFTILLNNMKLMAVLDWWQSLQDFILTKPNYIPPVPNVVSVEHEQAKQEANIPFELKLNITDSEIVVVENTSQWDSNAVILKSTTVITYRPLEIDKPVSCNLNHCEMFSCILGMEDETALSIIDPVTINMDILTRQTSGGEIYKVLKAQMVHLSLRLSYHDVKMFNQMLRSLPLQTQQARNQNCESQPVNLRSQLDKLKVLGFDAADCQQALTECSGKLDDAALWLTMNAESSCEPAGRHDSPQQQANHSPLSVDCLQVFMDSVSLCIIDDCRDADVPLMELSLSNLDLKHNLADFSGSCCSVLSAHYYNRLLSGWEPFIEPWKYRLCWDYTLSFAVTKTRLEVHVASADSLNINVTSSLVDLYKSVRDTWTDDYYHPKDSISVRGELSDDKLVSSPPGYRRRSPFVPFALHNDTGSRIWYTTVLATADSLTDRRLHANITEQNHEWVLVEHGTIAPFSFNERGKLRHRDTHKLKTHQVCIRVEGWSPVGPVTVDQVGVYFRQASPDYQMEKDLMQARIVVEVTLEGSARKLITIRSALQITNQLPHSLEIKLDNPRLQLNRFVHLVIPPDKSLSVPLLYTNSSMWARPLDVDVSRYPRFHSFCAKPLSWQPVTAPNQIILESRFCHANNSNSVYRFCVSTKRENYPGDRVSTVYSVPFCHPAHTITLLPPFTLVNLLPHELHVSINKESANRIKPGAQLTSHQVDLDSKLELNLHLDNFPQGGSIEVPCNAVSFSGRVKLHDHSNRRLYLHINTSYDPSSALKVNVFCPFWFINKTALPIVFKQDGVATETAGQYEEHEVARMIAPLLFSTSSFTSESDNCPTVVARIGSGVHPDGAPQWCSSLTLHCGVKMRRLRVSFKQNRPDLVYMIGIEIRPGRGRYRSTKIVTLSALFQIHNKSSFKLQFAQKCFATTVNDPGAQSTYLITVANCSLPFHWPRLDKDQLLCVKILDIPDCQWSGGFKVDDNSSFTLNIRDSNGRMYFLRMEIVLEGATYFILASDADTMPPPIRLDNYSWVPLQFHQSGLTNLSHTVKAHACVSYAWDEPTSPPILTVTAPGAFSASYDLEKLGPGPLLTYENFIYIAFTATFPCDGGSRSLLTEGLELVLDVPDPTTGKVVLNRKQPGARSQLWRMTIDGLLQHEGSSPPRAPADKILVLDICGPAPQPSQYVGLNLRRPDKRRSYTQSWRFTEGRLCCAHNNMCVQAKDGFLGLRSGSEVVLGPQQPQYFSTNQLSVPIEQAVSRQRLRPGSGCLAVTVTSDGPTRILRIIDFKEKKRNCLVSNEGGWVSVGSQSQARPPLTADSDSTPSVSQPNNEILISIELPKVGVSLTSQSPPEELAFITLAGIRFSSLTTASSEIYDISVQDIQIDNQQFEALCPVVFFVTPTSRSSDPDEAAKPVISITAERTPTKKTVNADIFKYFLARVKSISVLIDERLALKLFVFAGLHQEEEIENTDESDFETQRILAEAASVHSKRFYFDSLKLIFTQVRLSVLTCSKLNKKLLSMKRKLGWTLIRFEDAAIELEPFIRQYSFDTGQFLCNSILKHYKNEMKWQAGIILGSVDFLGNPLGFVNDVSEGFTGLIYEGNLGALVRNVAHGLSNSTAKFTETLGDGLGRVSLDESYEEARQRIRRGQTGSSGDHLMAGLKGLGFGLLGGVTSLFRQSYDGAAADGLPGFISGFGKGIVGTVTKPVVGVLDLASETASAVRDSSKSSSKQIPNKKRLPRCVISPTGFLPTYNVKQSLGQQFLYNINGGNFKELFMAYEVLRSGSEDLRIVISSTSIRIFSCGQSNDPSIVLEKNLSELLQCAPVSHSGSMGDQLHYIELLTRIETSTSGGPGVPGIDPVKRPRVRCDSEAIASWVSQQVNYAKAQFVERQHTLVSSDSLQEDS